MRSRYGMRMGSFDEFLKTNRKPGTGRRLALGLLWARRDSVRLRQQQGCTRLVCGFQQPQTFSHDVALSFDIERR